MSIEAALRRFEPEISYPLLEDAEIVYATHDTPVGPMVLAQSDGALIVNRFGDEASVTRWLAEKVSPNMVRVPRKLDGVRAQLDEYFHGARRRFDLRLSFRVASDFGRATLHALETVPFGETTTYAELARATGNPKAARAVGNALGANPLCIILPCPRVLRGGGALGGYAGGLEVKRFLLELERAR